MKDDKATIVLPELPKINEHNNEDLTQYPVVGYPDDENMWYWLFEVFKDITGNIIRAS